MFETSNQIDHPHITYGFFGRLGGVSKGLYTSLNCGVGGENSEQDVSKNKSTALTELGLEKFNLLSCYQVHSNICVLADKPWSQDHRPKADAIVTDQPFLALSVLTADCAPVVFLAEKDNSEPIIGIAHAGWRGAFGGVIESTVENICALGGGVEKCRAVIGPSIGQDSYEVSEEFMFPILKQDKNYKSLFRLGDRDGHFYFNLPGYVKAIIHKTGVQQVDMIANDTYKFEQEYYSYRRSVHRNEPDYGRQISIIAINSDKTG